jgi:peroxiredoxin
MSLCPPRRRSYRRREISVAALILLLASPAVTGARSAQVSADASACDAKPRPAKLNFTLRDVAGEKVTLNAFRGKVIILDFWATWCIPCRTEIPGFVELQRQYGAQGLQIIGVSVDDPVEKLKPYVAELKMNYPVLLGRDHNEVLDAFGRLPSVPTSVVIARDGSICTKHVGIAPMAVFEREILSLL